MGDSVTVIQNEDMWRIKTKDFQECFDPRAVGWGREPMRAAFFAYENEEQRQVAKASRHVTAIAES